jgi:hypothetical protein
MLKGALRKYRLSGNAVLKGRTLQTLARLLRALAPLLIERRVNTFHMVHPLVVGLLVVFACMQAKTRTTTEPLA